MVIHPETGKVVLAKAFDTYTTSDAFEDFIAHDIPDDYIIVAACKDDCANRLSYNVQTFFGQMGSQEIWQLKYRESFVFIG